MDSDFVWPERFSFGRISGRRRRIGRLTRRFGSSRSRRRFGSTPTLARHESAALSGVNGRHEGPARGTRGAGQGLDLLRGESQFRDGASADVVGPSRRLARPCSRAADCRCAAAASSKGARGGRHSRPGHGSEAGPTLLESDAAVIAHGVAVMEPLLDSEGGSTLPQLPGSRMDLWGLSLPRNGSGPRRRVARGRLQVVILRGTTSLSPTISISRLGRPTRTAPTSVSHRGHLTLTSAQRFGSSTIS